MNLHFNTPRKLYYLQNTDVFFFFFQNTPPSCRLNGGERRLCSLRGERSRERLVITRYSRRNWSKLLFFFSFFTTRLPSPPTQLIHPPHFLAHLRCNRPIFNDPLRKRCKNGEASNGEVKKWRMAKEREEERREAGLRNFHVINQPRSSGAFSFELVSSRIPSSLLNNREAVLRLL